MEKWRREGALDRTSWSAWSCETFIDVAKIVGQWYDEARITGWDQD
jgi:hypothetical protein